MNFRLTSLFLTIKMSYNLGSEKWTLDDVISDILIEFTLSFCHYHTIMALAYFSWHVCKVAN